METIIKVIRNYLVIASMFLMAHCSNAQDRVSLAVFQDAKLLTVGDNKGNEALTPNILARFIMQGKQQEWGYMIVFPEYEYANLKGGSFNRYSANVGYVFNKLFINKLEASFTGGYGWIDRQVSTFSASFTSGLNYKISENLKISTVLQLTDRTDLLIPELRLSGFIGIEFNIN